MLPLPTPSFLSYTRIYYILYKTLSLLHFYFMGTMTRHFVLSQPPKESWGKYRDLNNCYNSQTEYTVLSKEGAGR